MLEIGARLETIRTTEQTNAGSYQDASRRPRAGCPASASVVELKLEEKQGGVAANRQPSVGRDWAAAAVDQSRVGTCGCGRTLR